MSDDDDGPEYPVGYRKPPVATRFKRGTSGNPKGRPKSRRNLKSAARQVFTGSIVLREGAKTRRITKLEAILFKQIERALKGNDRAAQAATKLAEQLGLFRESDGEPVYDLTRLTDSELSTMEQIVKKIVIRRG